MLSGQFRQYVLRLAAQHHEVPSALLERLAQVLEAVEQERRPVLALKTAVEQALVEHEHRDHPLELVQRGAQRRVVVHAQVAAEPDEGGGRTSCGYGTGSRPDDKQQM